LTGRGDGNNIIIALSRIALSTDPLGVITRFSRDVDDIVCEFVDGEIILIGLA